MLLLKARLPVFLCSITILHEAAAEWDGEEEEENNTFMYQSDRPRRFAAAAARSMSGALKAASTKRAEVSIAIVDRHGHLALFERCAGAWLGSIDVAIKKARTALIWNSSTALLSRQTLPGETFYTSIVSNGGQVRFGGGVVLTKDGIAMGAIGVAGGSVPQDMDVADAGKKAFEQGEDEDVDQQSISTGQAKAALESAILATFNETCALKNHITSRCNMSVAVVDAGGMLMEFARMDDAWLGSVDVALKKAKTAALWCMDTAKLNRNFFEKVALSNGGLMTIPGGLVLKDGLGRCVGAIGVAGGSPAADRFVAQAGSRAASSLVKPRGILDIMSTGKQLRVALRAVSAAEAKAKEMNANLTVAIVDPGGSLIAFSRHENASLGTGDNALKKANAAALFGVGTRPLAMLTDPAKVSDEKESLRWLELTNGGLVTGHGGEAVKDLSGRVIFGVGVGGESVESIDAALIAAMNVTRGLQSQPVVAEDLARGVVEKSMEYAAKQQIGAPLSFCVVDRFLSTVKLHRDTGAWRLSGDLACKKARTAVLFRMPTEELGDLTNLRSNRTKPGPLHGLEVAQNFVAPAEILAANAWSAGAQFAGLITFGGGRPLTIAGKLLGGFGVAGSTVLEDTAVCAAGTEHLQAPLGKYPGAPRL
eukprot:TRINITY_DN14406_c0_g2_i1.p1 TRINITY_DN14406_c0_g2~~TRINITY_DN14406_c0_g2_i1.p1  ORF type:complete len:651 (-),score=115.26 TRINITY_DN14406_c0_g2_i1:58-2010(-)